MGGPIKLVCLNLKHLSAARKICWNRLLKYYWLILSSSPHLTFIFQSFSEKVANVTLAFELMQDAGLARPKARPEDIVNLDLKSTLRVLYNLFTKYKHLN